MSWAVRAWRDATGAAGVVIGTVTAVGYDNFVAEIELGEREMPGFLAECTAALERARASPGILHEPLPGPYDKWPPMPASPPAQDG